MQELSGGVSMVPYETYADFVSEEAEAMRERKAHAEKLAEEARQEELRRLADEEKARLEAIREAEEASARASESKDKEAKKDSKKDGPDLTKVALLFPGQGAHYMGMFKKAIHLDSVKDLCRRAQPILGYRIEDVVGEEDGDSGWMVDQRIIQPALFVAGMAGIEKLKAEEGEVYEHVQATAGFSIGEWVAVCAAGVMSFEDGLAIVKARADASWNLCNAIGGAMISIIGYDKEKLIREIEKCNNKGYPCWLANDLFPDAHTCGGPVASLNALQNRCQGATRATIVGNEGAFHTPMMQPVKDHVGGLLDAALPRMSPNKFSIYMSAGPAHVPPGTAPEAIIALLKEHITGPIHWQGTVETMVADNVSCYFECGPMKSIKQMMNRIDKDALKRSKNCEV